MSFVLPTSAALPTRTSRATRTAGVAVALALGLSGCGAGLRAQTYQERATSDATNEAIGALAIRHLRVLPPTATETYGIGSDARVGLIVVNEGAEADRLTTVTSDAAARVEVLGPNGRPGTLTTQPNTATSGFVLVLRGLTRALRPGQYVQMELTFAENGSKTMLVPVEVTGTPGPRRQGYKIGETDSSGEAIVEEGGTEGGGGGGQQGAEGAAEQGAGSAEEGAADRPELDTDGGDAASGDAEPDVVSDPLGDENGGRGATQPPPAG